MSDLVKLLRAMATGTDYIAHNHDVILRAAADEIERLSPTHGSVKVRHWAVVESGTDIVIGTHDDIPTPRAGQSVVELHGSYSP